MSFSRVKRCAVAVAPDPWAGLSARPTCRFRSLAKRHFPIDNPESRVEFRIRKMHSLHLQHARFELCLEFQSLEQDGAQIGSPRSKSAGGARRHHADRSVTRAGQRLGLSQPAMSHALTRLRHMLKDELFVRSPNGMVPTPRADELATPIRIALDGLQQSLEPVQFDASTATASFRIAVDNYAAIVLVAPIAAHVARVAPG